MSLTNKPTINEITNSVSTLDSNFLPKDTIITVELDGSGDFTTINEAIEFLYGKYSNGKITIEIGEGTFENVNTIFLDLEKYNIPIIQIKGKGQNKTTLSFSEGDTFLSITSGKIELSDLTLIRNTSKTIDGSIAYGIYVICGGMLYIKNVTIEKCSRALYAIQGGNIYIGDGAININNCYWGIISWLGSHISLLSSNVTFSNMLNAYVAYQGGMIGGNGAHSTYNNVTTQTVSDNGSIIVNV